MVLKWKEARAGYHSVISQFEVSEGLSQGRSGHLCSPCASGAALSEFKEGIKVGPVPCPPCPVPPPFLRSLEPPSTALGSTRVTTLHMETSHPLDPFFDKRGEEWNLKDHPCHGVSPAANFTGLQSSVLASHCENQSQEQPGYWL